jgi:hypothetical protein
MNLLTPDGSGSQTDISVPKTIRLVSIFPTEVRPKRASQWLIVFGVLGAFVGGFGLSSYWRPPILPSDPKIQIADFRVEVPEGETTVVLTSREGNRGELGRLEIKRQGDEIVGLPQEVRRIAAREDLSVEDVAFFRRELDGVVAQADSEWDKANKIRVWLTRQPHRLAMPGLTSRVPRQAYEQMKHGEPVLCGNLADIYVALCQAVGLTARAVGLSVVVQNGGFGVDTHAGAEVWIQDRGGWIYQDPTFNCYWSVDGTPAGALTIHDAVMAGRPIAFGPSDPRIKEGLCNYYIDPRLYFRHISYEYKPGGQVLYFADKRLEPLSLNDKNWIHTSDRFDIQRLDTGGNLVVERRTQISPGIFVQLLDGDLFVRDRRERSPGIRVRSSSGAVEGCAYLHQRAEDLGMFSAENIARNPSFRLTNRSNQLAESWSITGPVEAMTVSGGQAMAALAGGRLWQRIHAKPRGRYLLYARVSVSRGLVTWTLGDAAHGAMSRGTIEPERISEVVSDVVESDSGYLDVQFEVPSGGSFRVMDVIVAEAPRFTDDSSRPASDARKQIAGMH